VTPLEILETQDCFSRVQIKHENRKENLNGFDLVQIPQLSCSPAEVFDQETAGQRHRSMGEVDPNRMPQLIQLIIIPPIKIALLKYPPAN